MLALVAPTVIATPAHADNNRLNLSVVKMVYIVQHQAGCTNNVRIDPRLQLAAQWHSVDLRDNRALDADIGSDGSSPQDRAIAAGYHGQVQETVAINPALSITSLEVINQWYYDPEQFAIMRNCANTEVGVWSENSLDRTVLVAVYGHPV
ncbi:CAP domain-containing protein [Mycobacterium sp. 050128]